MTRRALWGAAALAGYAGAVAVTGALGLVVVRPLFDGLAPPAPYRYVNPPPDVEDPGEPPEPFTGTLAFGPEGSEARSIMTPDGQAFVVFAQGALAPREGEGSVEVVFTPLDPNRLGEPPEGLRFDGNAYRIEARYEGSKAPASLTQDVTVVLRYPVHATTLLRTSGRAWRRISTKPSPAGLQLFAETADLGTFVAAGPQVGGGFPYWTLPAGAAGAAAVVAGLLSRRGRRRPKTRADRRRQARRRR